MISLSITSMIGFIITIDALVIQNSISYTSPCNKSHCDNICPSDATYLPCTADRYVRNCLNHNCHKNIKDIMIKNCNGESCKCYNTTTGIFQCKNKQIYSLMKQYMVEKCELLGGKGFIDPTGVCRTCQSVHRDDVYSHIYQNECKRTDDKCRFGEYYSSNVGNCRNCLHMCYYDGKILDYNLCTGDGICSFVTNVRSEYV
jgi:hypothetical protein